MKVIVNGVEKNFIKDITLSILLAELGYANKRVAIEINEEIIPKSKHENKFIIDGDKIEIIKAVGGG